jgi:hypothetical protein
MILTNSNRFWCLKFRHLIYLCMVGTIIWFWQIQTVFGVWNSHTQFISAWLVYIYDFNKTSSNRFRCLKFRHLIYIYMVGTIIWFWQIQTVFGVWNSHTQFISAWLVYIYDFNKTSSNRFRCLKFRHIIYLCMVGIYIWFWQTQTVFGVWNSDTQFISACLVFIYDFDKTSSNRFRCLKFKHPIYLCMVGIYIWFWQTQTVFDVWNSDT